MRVLVLATLAVLIGAWVITRPTDPSVRGIPAGHGNPEVTRSTSGPAPRATPTRAARTRPAPTRTPTQHDTLNWKALRLCESSNDYRADTGNGYHGAYQFDLSTWRSVGGRGNPAHATPDEQDKRARILYARRGEAPWPVCGKKLR